MAYVIGDSCISCGSCEGQCPVGAISMGEGKFEIDAAAMGTVLYFVISSTRYGSR